MKPYTVTQINEHVYQIAEVYHKPAALPMYLVVGTRRAALIDTGMGLGCLRKTVEEITSLPVVVCNTHAHLDHAAGNDEFDRVYMHPEEVQRARSAANFPIAGRLEFMELKCMYDPATEELLQYARANLPEYKGEYPITTVTDGDVIDLGGIRLEVVEIPGHTTGSIVFVDREDKMAFCGDAVNPRGSIGMWPGAPTVRGYADAMERFMAMTTDIERFYVGHRLYYFRRSDLEDILACAREIVAGAPGEPVALVLSRETVVRAWIHWHNGKRITYQKECIG